jgi:hypothetical protein
MKDLSHLNALENGLANELMRLSNAKTAGEREMRTVWVNQRKKEIAGEKKFLGIEETALDVLLMSDDELLAELSA